MHIQKRVAFDMFRKVDVSGEEAHPLFKWLLAVEGEGCADDNQACPEWAQNGECNRNSAFMRKKCRLSCNECVKPDDAGSPIRWNFESFLLTRNGNLHIRWPTGTDLTASEQLQQIEKLLDAKEEL